MPKVRAGRSDGEELVCAAHEEHRFAVRVADEHGAIRNGRGDDAFGEIRSGECVVHAISVLRGAPPKYGGSVSSIYEAQCPGPARWASLIGRRGGVGTRLACERGV